MKLLLFTGKWSSPCLGFVPVIQEIATRRGLDLEEVDVDEHPDLTLRYTIKGVPTVALLDDAGAFRGAKLGASQADPVDEWLCRLNVPPF